MVEVYHQLVSCREGRTPVGLEHRRVSLANLNLAIVYIHRYQRSACINTNSVGYLDSTHNMYIPRYLSMIPEARETLVGLLNQSFMSQIKPLSLQPHV